MGCSLICFNSEVTSLEFVVDELLPELLPMMSESEKLLPEPTPPITKLEAKTRISAMKMPRIQPFCSRMRMSMALSS